MFSKEYIKEQLKVMGAPTNRAVIVHTSLRAIGEVYGRAQGLLETFKEYFTENGGALIVPTHTWTNFDEKKDIILDFTIKETCLGVFPTVALADKDGVRTDNPTHSAVVFGYKPIVDELIKDESTALTPTSPKSVYGKLCDMDGYILLVGVGQEKNTYIHAVEEILSVSNRLSNVPAKMKVKYFDGKVKEREFNYLTEELGDTSLYFPKYEPAFRKYGVIKDGVIGKAKAQLCSAKKIKEVMELIYKNSNGIELLADDKPIPKEYY